MEIIGKTVTAITLMIFSGLMQGYTLVKLWSWIIVPTFGVKAIGMASALGISTIVGILLMGITMNMKQEKNQVSFIANLFGKTFAMLFIYSFALLAGYIYSQFI